MVGQHWNSIGKLSGPVSCSGQESDAYRQPNAVEPAWIDTSTQCRFNTGPPSAAVAINHSTLDNAFCWLWCVHRVQADTDAMYVKCWASVAGAGQYPYSPSQYLMLAVPAQAFEPKLG